MKGMKYKQQCGQGLHHPSHHCHNLIKPARILAGGRHPVAQCRSLNRIHELTFPHKGLHDFDGKQLTSQEVINLLEPYVTPERAAKMEAAVAKRTYSVVPILESTYDMGNLAAVCRSADAFSFGAVHYVKRSDDKYKTSARTSAGAEKWLDVKVYENTTECIQAIKAAGLQLVVTHLSRSSVTVQEVDFTKPTAIVLGNEKWGASEEIVAAADHCAIIPMAGFVESFNISVAGALVMYEAQQQRLRAAARQRQEQGEDGPPVPLGDLSPQQQLDLRASFLLRSVREPRTLIREILSRPPPQWQEGRVKSREARMRRALQQDLATASSSGSGSDEDSGSAASEQLAAVV